MVVKFYMVQWSIENIRVYNPRVRQTRWSGHFHWLRLVKSNDVKKELDKHTFCVC